MQKKLITIFTIIFSFLLIVEPVHAFTMGSVNFTIDGANFDNGGGDSSSPNYLVVNSAGENVLAQASSANFTDNPGLVFFNPTPTPTSAPASSSTSTSTTTTTTVVTATPTPTPTPTSSQIVLVPNTAQESSPTSAAPTQLFDIALIIDKQLIDDSRKLAARVTFTSFGTKDTAVDMEFVVQSQAGKELYKTTGKTVIQTEGVYNQMFKNLSIPDGKYTLLLSTLYNVNVKDEFRQPFEVRSQKGFLSLLWPWGLFIIPPFLLLLVIILWKRRRKI